MRWGTKEELQKEHNLSDHKFKILLRIERIDRRTVAGSPRYRLAEVGPGSWLTLTEARERYGLRLTSGEWFKLQQSGKWQAKRAFDQTFVRKIQSTGGTPCKIAERLRG